jgi:hypothetical protein
LKDWGAAHHLAPYHIAATIQGSYL